MKIYTHSKYSYIKVVEIPKSEIRKIDFSLCKQPRETLSSFYNRQADKPDIVSNLGFFNMSNGDTCFNLVSNYQAINSTALYQWGMGIVGDANIEYGGLSLKNNWRCFVSGYPNLIAEGKKIEIDFAKEINYKARRTMLGYNSNSIFLVLVENPGLTFNEMQDVMLGIGCTYAINLDGGGSTKALHNGVSITKNSTNRAVDSVLAVYLKHTNTINTDRVDVMYQTYSNGKWMDKVTNYNTHDYNGYAGADKCPIQAVKMCLSNGSVQYRVHTVSGTWLPWVTDNSDYAGIIGNNNILCCFNGRFRLTSPRDNRVLNGKSEFHKGIDLVGLDDTTVYSISDGTVRTAYQANGAGNYVVVTMADGRRVFYMHLAKFLVKTGATIKKGTPIGIMGNTGNVTGTHTHLELRPAGTTNESIDICAFTGIPNKVGVYENSVGKNIDAIQVKLISDIANTHQIKYRVSTTSNVNYLPWVVGDSDYAGMFGYPIDKIQMTVQSK